MGEARKDGLRLDFDRRLKLEFHGAKVTSNAGLPAYRELDEALGLTSAIELDLRETRTGKNTQHGLAALLRQSIYSRLAGYDDTNGAERLRAMAGGLCLTGGGGACRLLFWKLDGAHRPGSQAGPGDEGLHVRRDPAETKARADGDEAGRRGAMQLLWRILGDN